MALSGVHMTADDIPIDDPTVYAMLSTGDTDGLFQLKARACAALSELKPETFEDIIAAISLYRPGPMASIPALSKAKTTRRAFAISRQNWRPF